MSWVGSTQESLRAALSHVWGLLPTLAEVFGVLRLCPLVELDPRLGDLTGMGTDPSSAPCQALPETSSRQPGFSGALSQNGA